MLPWLGSAQFGNPSSDHEFGRQALSAVEFARAQVATSIGARRTDIIFTSGATEACNLALFGIAPHLKAQGKMRIVTLANEHAAVSMPLKQMTSQGFELIHLKIKPDGLIDFDDLKNYHSDKKLG